MVFVRLKILIEEDKKQIELNIQFNYFGELHRTFLLDIFLRFS